MGHYSDVYFGYTAEIADKIERLFEKTIGKLPEEVFEDTMWGQYDSNSGNRYGTPYQYPVWQIMSTERTKWYQSYNPEGDINNMVELMAKDNETYPESEWFFVRIGESFPADLRDFDYLGSMSESFMDFKVKVYDYGSASGSGSYGFTKSKDRSEFESGMEVKPAHSIGTINYTFIEEYIDYYNLENRVEPVDEYFS